MFWQWVTNSGRAGVLLCDSCKTIRKGAVMVSAGLIELLKCFGFFIVLLSFFCFVGVLCRAPTVGNVSRGMDNVNGEERGTSEG